MSFHLWDNFDTAQRTLYWKFLSTKTDIIHIFESFSMIARGPIVISYLLFLVLVFYLRSLEAKSSAVLRITLNNLPFRRGS